MTKSAKAPKLLTELLNARSPSGYEFEAQKVLDTLVKPHADTYNKDALGNRIATVNPKGDPVLMFAGHMDELGLIVRYIDNDGFIYFDTIGGHDATIISGRRVSILTRKGANVKGITGKRALHLMTPEDRKKVPKIHDIWIDIGAKNKKEAEKHVSIGDAIVYDHGFEILSGTIATARAFDNKAGCYIVNETLCRLAKSKKKLAAQVVAVSTTQEEIGVRGAVTASYNVNPHLAVAVDVGHATDHPDSNKKKDGAFALGKGPIICRGPNINPKIFEKLLQCAEKSKIPYQLESDPRPTGTDARAIQMTRGGVATGLISVPLRYMHTPSEVVDLKDVENCVKLLVAFASSLKKGDYCHF